MGMPCHRQREPGSFRDAFDQARTVWPMTHRMPKNQIPCPRVLSPLRSMPMRLLVLDGDSNAAQSVIQSLGRRGHTLCLGATDPRGPTLRSRYVAQRVIYPDPLIDKDAFKAWVLRFQRANSFSLILPTTESTLVPLHELRGVSEFASSLVLPRQWPSRRCSTGKMFDGGSLARYPGAREYPSPRFRWAGRSSHRRVLR